MSAIPKRMMLLKMVTSTVST